MTTQDQIKKTVADFVLAGDTNDVVLLDAVLHNNFQNVQDGFFDEKGIFVFSKEDYKHLVETKRFGGAARTIEFKSIEISGNIAHAKVRLESEFLIFHSGLLLGKEGDRWQVIHNIPKTEKKW